MPQLHARAGKPCAAAILVAWLQFSSQTALAADLPGGTLTLTTSSEAVGCPEEEELARELRGRSSSTPTPTLAPIQLGVQIEAVDGTYVAQIRVSGRKQGERTLRTEGPSCQGLRDALIVSLLLLLDDDPDAPRSAAPAATQPLAPPPAHARPSAPSQQARDPRAASLWLELGAAGTHGLPHAFSAAFEAGVSFRARRWEVGALGFWAAPREVRFEPGTLDVGLRGASLSGCLVPVELSQALRLSACGVAAAAELSVEPRGFTRAWPRKRPLFLAGVGFEPRYTFGTRASLGLSFSLLAPLLRERFSVQGLGEGYATDHVVGKAGLELGFRFW